MWAVLRLTLNSRMKQKREWTHSKPGLRGLAAPSASQSQHGKKPMRAAGEGRVQRAIPGSPKPLSSYLDKQTKAGSVTTGGL